MGLNGQVNPLSAILWSHAPSSNAELVRRITGLAFGANILSTLSDRPASHAGAILWPFGQRT